MNSYQRDKEIQDLFIKLDNKLSISKKKSFHFKSVHNFIFHLVENNKYRKGINKKLQRLGEERVKVLLFEYLVKINNEELDLDYKKYIQEIGAFMMKYYNFSYFGGKILFFNLLIILSFGLLTDMLVYLFSGKTLYIFSVAFIFWFIITVFLKYHGKRVFGYHY